MTCKDCLGNYLGYCKFDCLSADKCDNFQDRSAWVKLPCKVGDKIWIIRTLTYPIKPNEKRDRIITQDKIQKIFFERKGLSLKTFMDTISAQKIGKTVFLSREEAERALKGV